RAFSPYVSFHLSFVAIEIDRVIEEVVELRMPVLIQRCEIVALIVGLIDHVQLELVVVVVLRCDCVCGFCHDRLLSRFQNTKWTRGERCYVVGVIGALFTLAGAVHAVHCGLVRTLIADPQVGGDVLAGEFGTFVQFR
ncbi:MAG TPA: hypothetical protein VL461_11580, partial [Dictyobacter sp.]|nr:hypothetical protein [Dictyobacter sp.]